MAENLRTWDAERYGSSCIRTAYWMYAVRMQAVIGGAGVWLGKDVQIRWISFIASIPAEFSGLRLLRRIPRAEDRAARSGAAPWKFCGGPLFPSAV